LKTKIAFIGAGQMGGALARGMIQSKIVAPEQIVLSDINQERLSQLHKELGVGIAKDNIEAVKSATVVILAVKPQQLESVLEEIKNSLAKKQILVSIAAGVSTKAIKNKLGKDLPIVRVMPNSPALVNKSISVISPSPSTSRKATSLVAKLFSGVGKVVFIDESFQNQAMALSGCGPAYFYYFVEGLIEAGRKSGLAPEIAKELVIETLIGAGAMLAESGKPPKELREMVTSPGGTTLAALNVFEQAVFFENISKAVQAAIKRATELEI